MQTQPRIPTLVCLSLFLSVFLFTARGYYGGDHFLSYMTAESIVLNRSLYLMDRWSDVPEIRAHQEGQTRAVTGSDGHRYTIFGIALPLAMAPFYLAGHIMAGLLPSLPHDMVTMFCVSLTNSVITALTCVVFIAYATCFGFTNRTATLLGLWYAFGTMAWNYSQYSFVEPLALLCILCTLLAVHRICHTDQKPLRWALLGGLAAGCGLWTEAYPTLIVAGVTSIFLIVWWWRQTSAAKKQSLPILIAFGAILVGFGALLMLFNVLIRFGSPTAGRMYGDFSWAYPPVAVYILLFSPGKSIFLYCPVLIVSFWGVRQFAQEHRAEAYLFLGIAVSSISAISTWVDAWSGASWGPRYFFHLVPLLLLAAGYVLESAQWRQLSVWFKVGFSIVALAVQIPSIAVNLGRYRAMMPGYSAEALYIPYFSPIIGHWLLILSNVSRLLRGSALTIQYPNESYVTSWPIVNAANFDQLDLWFVNVLASGSGGRLRAAVAVAAIAMVIWIVFSGVKLWRWLPDTT
jgi:hypothetical protein